jgi:hypothetical protein
MMDLDMYYSSVIGQTLLRVGVTRLMNLAIALSIFRV